MTLCAACRWFRIELNHQPQRDEETYCGLSPGWSLVIVEEGATNIANTARRRSIALWWRRGEPTPKGDIMWKGVARMDSCVTAVAKMSSENRYGKRWAQITNETFMRGLWVIGRSSDMFLSPVKGSFATRELTCGFRKMLGNSWVAAQPTASQEGLIPMELMTCLMPSPKQNCLNSFDMKHFALSETITPGTENAGNTLPLRVFRVQSSGFPERDKPNFEKASTQTSIIVFPNLLRENFRT
jgi:hypothetical protein